MSKDKATSTEEAPRSSTELEETFDVERVLPDIPTASGSSTELEDVDRVPDQETPTASGSSTELEDIDRVPETPTGSGSSTELESDYETDPDCPEGVIPQTQPCIKNGIQYIPHGLRKVYRKKRRLN